MDTVDGTVIVRNGSSGVLRPGEEWILAEEVRVGAVEGVEWEQFGGLSVVALGPDGRMAAIDFQAQHVRVFGREGAFIGTVGGPGRGPGEFDGPLALAWDDEDRLWVVDGWNRRYRVFAPDGGVVATVPRPIRPAGFRQRLLFGGPDHFVDETTVRGEDGTVVFALVRVDTTGSVIDTLPLLLSPSLGTGAVRLPDEVSPYVPRLVFTVAPDGTVWFGRSDEPRLYQRGPDGDTLRIVQMGHREFGLTAEDEAQIDAIFARARLSRPDLQLGRPVIQGIHVLDDGHLLVRVGDEPGEDATELDAYDSEGRFLGTISVGFPIQRNVAPAFRGDTMLAVTRDEFDVQRIVRVTIHRSGH